MTTSRSWSPTRRMPRCRARANDYLKEINTLLQSSDIYVMLPDGDTIAASNFDGADELRRREFQLPALFPGRDRGQAGPLLRARHDSLKRGYYFSSPVLVGGEIRGVVVFKVDIDAIEASWKGGDNEIIVSDPEGIIFMTGRPDWLYASLLPLTPERLARTGSLAPLRQCDVARTAGRRAASFESRHALMTVTDADGSGANIWCSPRTMPEAGWTVHVLARHGARRAPRRSPASLPPCCCSASPRLAGAIVLQRRARLAERMEMQRSARVELEHRVDERTADLALVNRQLETEVAERRATEQQLRQTPVRPHPGRQARRARPDVGGAVARIQPAAGRGEDLCRQCRDPDRPQPRRGSARQCLAHFEPDRPHGLDQPASAQFRPQAQREARPGAAGRGRRATRWKSSPGG